MAQVVGARILGIVENMAEFVAPVLARLPIDPQVAALAERVGAPASHEAVAA